MYKTILCAVEISDEGEKVLSKAYELSQLYNAKLLVANVIPYTILPKDYQKELKENALPLLKSKVSSLGLGIPDKAITVKVGKPYEQIYLFAEKKNVDLIILGTHSKKGINALIGSTANGVANYAKCDVLLVRI